MSPIESLEAIRRLTEVAREYPALAPQLIGVIEGVLKPEPAANMVAEPVNRVFSMNGHAHTNGQADAEPALMPQGRMFPKNAQYSAGHINNGEPKEPGGKNNRIYVPMLLRPEPNERCDRNPESYMSQADMAAQVGRSVFTIGRWCRDGKIKAIKHPRNCGGAPRWVISIDEVRRYERDGLRSGSFLATNRTYGQD